MYAWPTPRPALETAVAIVSAAFGDYAPVSVSMPRQVPPRFIKMARIGGSRPNPVTDLAAISLDVFALDHATVEYMCSTLDEAMHNAIGTIVNNTFIRDWGNIVGPIGGRPHPDLLSMIRMTVVGDLMLSTSTPAVVPPGS